MDRLDEHRHVGLIVEFGFDHHWDSTRNLNGEKRKAQSIVTPILDFMQTMPGFVYLIPAVAFFGIGMVPGVFASVIFALPPTVRMTNLGFAKFLVNWKLIPSVGLAKTDQIRIATSQKHYFGWGQPNHDAGIINGRDRVNDRCSWVRRGLVRRNEHKSVTDLSVGYPYYFGDHHGSLYPEFESFGTSKAASKTSRKQNVFWRDCCSGSRCFDWSIAVFGNVSDSKGTVNLAYVEWDTEVASTHVVAEVLSQMGYEVNTTPLDNAIMWESVAKGEVDGMVAAWLPSTHQSQYEQYQDQVENLGPNLEGQNWGSLYQVIWM